MCLDQSSPHTRGRGSFLRFKSGLRSSLLLQEKYLCRSQEQRNRNYVQSWGRWGKDNCYLRLNSLLNQYEGALPCLCDISNAGYWCGLIELKDLSLHPAMPSFMPKAGLMLEAENASWKWRNCCCVAGFKSGLQIVRTGSHFWLLLPTKKVWILCSWSRNP